MPLTPHFELAKKDLQGILDKLNEHLALKMFFVGNEVGLADIEILSTLWNVRRFCGCSFGVNLERWWNYLERLDKVRQELGKCWVI